jgi:O6-methylguanine-DNA--protein-cysteine methyltransferase
LKKKRRNSKFVFRYCDEVMHFEGHLRNISDELKAFYSAVYTITSAIPLGRVTSYGKS